MWQQMYIGLKIWTEKMFNNAHEECEARQSRIGACKQKLFPWSKTWEKMLTNIFQDLYVTEYFKLFYEWHIVITILLLLIFGEY